MLGSARAQTTSDPATARALFRDARKLMADKHYDEACPKFEESQRLDSGIGTMFNLADCWEHSGRSASAWAMFLDTAAAARAASQEDRAKVAKERAAKLEPKLSHMTIRLASAEQGLEVRRDGQLVGQAAYNTAVPVDPGLHRIEVTATGKKPFTSSVDVGASASASVEVPKLENADSAAPATGAAGNGAPGAPAANATQAAGGSPDVGPGAGRSKVLPYTLLGVGVVGLAIGTVFELKSRGSNSDALGICPGDGACTQADVTRHDGLVSDAKTDQLIAIVGAGVGAASLITAVVLLTTEHAASAPQAAHNFSLDFGAGPSSAAVLAKGRF
ncbi:MAG TPA: hypothetical protein VNG33_07820 [Polyangiaceae bacterium]|nr:hypothetical protein [Polyangiaceae bacterium]